MCISCIYDVELWVLSRMLYAFISIYSITEQRYIHQQVNINRFFNKKRYLISSILEVKKNHFFIASNEGLMVYDQEADTIKNLFNSPVNNLLYDDNNILWISSNKGVFYIDFNGLETSIIAGINNVTTFEWNNEDLWIGHDNGISIYQNESNNNKIITK